MGSSEQPLSSPLFAVSLSSGKQLDSRVLWSKQGFLAVSVPGDTHGPMATKRDVTGVPHAVI